MLRHLVILAMVACGISASKSYTAEKEFLIKQKSIYDLLWHIDQPTVAHPELKKIATSYSIEANIESYTNKVAVKEFLQRYEFGMLPRDAVFSLFYPELREEAVALFRLFYYAKDFETFYKTAVWARFHVNKIQFIYALSVAVVHRHDTRFIRLPEIYEILPYGFYNPEVFHQAKLGRMHDFNGTKTTVDGVDTVIIPARHSSWYMHHEEDEESKLNYFTEDVGLNAYYYTLSLDFPFWMSSEEFDLPKGYRGEQYLYAHLQLLNRYKLERLSNGMGKIEHINWNRPIITGYYPNYVYHNGLPFPKRESWSKIPVDKYKYSEEVQMLESRITEAIDSGYVIAEDGKMVNIYTPEGYNILGNFIEGNADSYNKRFYGSYDFVARHVLGFSPEPVSKYQVVPAALEQFRTSMKDPAFYRLYNKIVGYFIRYKSNLPMHTYEEIVYPGVKFESVTVNKLVTYFTEFDVMLNNAMVVKSDEDSISYFPKARQYRLKHKPFTFHMTVNSDKPTKAMFRIFLGPKYDEFNHELPLSENWMNFYEMDMFSFDLVAGVNKIERSSTESMFAIEDPLSSDLFYQKLEKAMEEGQSFTYTDRVYGFPERLLLPKGRKEGMPFQFFFYVSEINEAHGYEYNSPLWGKAAMDGKPMGFPLDRPMYGFNFTVPNMYFKTVDIFHMKESEINLTN